MMYWEIRLRPNSGNHWSDQYKYTSAKTFIAHYGEMADGETWSNGRAEYFSSSTEANNYAREHFYWNQYGGEEISRGQWLGLVGVRGNDKYADHYYPGAWELQQRDRSDLFHFFSASDERYGLEYMLLAQERYQKEVSAYLVDGPNGCGVLILPWSGNSRTESNRYIGYNSRTKTISDSNNITHRVLLHIHTHPDDGGTDISWRPSDDDILNTRDQGIPGVILAPRCYILINTSLSPTGHIMNAPYNGGSTPDLLKGYDSLYRFMK